MKKTLSLFKISSILLLGLLVFVGWSHIPLLIHWEAEKDNPAHNAQTCPQCKQLQSIASVLIKSDNGVNIFTLKDYGTPILFTAPVLKSRWSLHTISRAPPFA